MFQIRFLKIKKNPGQIHFQTKKKSNWNHQISIPSIFKHTQYNISADFE